MAGNNAVVTSSGPALGNVPTPDYYLRIKKNIETLHANVSQALLLANESKALTPDQLSQLQKALQAGGPNPLNLTALPGIVLQPQKANIPAVNALPFTGSSSEGQVVLYRHVIWRFSATTHSWSPASTIVIVDFSYNLSKYPPAQYAPGVLYVAFDTGTVYVEEDVVRAGVTTPTWVVLFTETVALLHADRRSSGTLNTTANNNGSPVTWASGEHFRSEMVGQQIWISGNLYPVASFNNNNAITLGSNVGNLTGANYVFEYPSVNYPVGEIFIETDRNVEYYAANATGLVNISGNNVTWVSGQKFDVYWKSILFGNNTFTVASVSQNRTALVVTAAPGNNNNVAYVVISGAWFYATGTFSSNLNNIPTDLEDVDANYSFGAADYYHLYRWSGNNNNFSWNFAPGDPGSAYIVTGSPIGGLWALCDGNVATCATANGNTTGVTTPNLTGDVFLKGGTPSGQQNATKPTWQAGAHTDPNTVGISLITDPTSIAIGNANITVDAVGDHTHDINIINFNVAAGNNLLVSAVGSPTVQNGAHSHTLTPNPHNHVALPDPHQHTISSGNSNSVTFNLSNNNAVLNEPSETNGGLPLRISLAWYMRR